MDMSSVWLYLCPKITALATEEADNKNVVKMQELETRMKVNEISTKDMLRRDRY